MYYKCLTLLLACFLVFSVSNADVTISNECLANLTDSNESTTCNLNQTSNATTYENIINNMSEKLNMSNETLFAFFDSLEPEVFINISDSEFVNKSYIDDRLSSFSYSIQQVNSSVNIGLDNYLKTFTNSYLFNSTETIKHEFNEKIGSLENRTARKIEMSEMSDNLTNTIYIADSRLRNDLGSTLNSYAFMLFIAAVTTPFGVFFLMTRFKPVRMKFLGASEGTKHYISDLDHSPTLREKIQKIRALKNSVLKSRSYNPRMKIKLLEKIDKSEIDTEAEIAKEAELISLEQKAKEAMVNYEKEVLEPVHKKKK